MPRTIRHILLCVLFGSILVVGGTSASLAGPPLQEDGSVQTVTHDQTGFYTFVGIDAAAPDAALPGASALQAGTPTAAAALADISVYASRFGLDNPAQELQFRESFASPGGSTTFRYQQVYQGVPILAGEMLANYNPAGRLSALAGETSPKLVLSTTPTVTADTAAQVALAHVERAASTPTAELTASAPALWIYDARLLQPSDFPARLVWRTEVTPAQGHLPIRYLVLVDAQIPTVALAFNQVDTLWGERAASRAASAAGRPAVSTANLPAFAPNFANPPGVTYDSQGKPIRPGITVCTTPPTALSGTGSCDRTASISAANMAHYFAYNTTNYFDLHHQRNSIDNKGMKLISHVNYRESAGTPFANAFWDGLQMTYGDADIYTVDDVVAHELSHGVTERSSGLFYFYESGAINESMSDVFGEFADQWNGRDSFNGTEPDADKWKMGEDMNSGELRNMQDPTFFGDPDSTQSPNYFPGPGDNGGVHFNSGVSNKAAYLMAAGGSFNGYTITALGNAKTSAIYYEANTRLLTSGADYQMLGAALVQACYNVHGGKNPFGITAADCNEVYEVTRAVGMHLEPRSAGFAPSTELCPAGQQPVNFLFRDNFEAGLSNFVDGTLVNPSGMPQQWAFQTTQETFGQPYAISGASSMFGVNHPALFGGPQGEIYTYVSYSAMKNGVTLPVGSTYYLHFNHSVALEAYSGDSNIYDGAVLQYSLNNGVWTNAGSLFSAGKNYDGTIHSGFGNPWLGQPAFGGHSHGYVSSRYNLSSLAGGNVKFRWVIAADGFGAYYGWFIDDVQIYTCNVPTSASSAAPVRNVYTTPTVTLTWNLVTWAVDYEVQVSKSPSFTSPVTLPADGAGDLDVVTPLGLGEGTYYWRVRAQRANGTWGSWSAGETFVIDL